MAGPELPVAVTMGDAAGIGPEIVAKTFADPAFDVPAIVVGDLGVLTRTVEHLGIALEVREISEPENRSNSPGVMNVIGVGTLPEDFPLGVVDARAGAAAFAYVERAVQLARARRVLAIATAPLHKESLHAAGVTHPGHTEILAELTGTGAHAMMLFNEDIRVMLVTIHLALRAAIDALTVERELMIIRLAAHACRDLGVDRPRVAVAGLNPHAGEGGLFGTEDAEVIAPAVRRACEEGIDASGPWPGDTVFMQAREGRFDIVVAQYHDQGLIPVKYLGIDRGVNATVGLPFVRTSVDHGTAFDIAGTGRAEHASMRTAIESAAAMAAARAAADLK